MAMAESVESFRSAMHTGKPIRETNWDTQQRQPLGISTNLSATAIPLPPEIVAENVPPQSTKCEICNQEELNGMQTLPCRICRKRLHKECLIKEARYSKLEAQLIERSAEKIGWSCHSCENTYKLLTNEERLTLNWNFDNFHIQKGLPIDEQEYLRFIRERHNDRHLVPLSKKKEDMQIILFRRLDRLQVGQVDYWEFLKHESAKILELRNERDLVKMLQPDELTAAHNMFEAINRELGTPEDYMEARTAYRRWYKDKGKMEQIKEHEKSMIARKRMLRDSIQYDSKIPAMETRAFNFSEDFPEEYPDAACREDFADAADYDFSRYIKSVKGDSVSPAPLPPPPPPPPPLPTKPYYPIETQQITGADDSSNHYYQEDRLPGGTGSVADVPLVDELGMAAPAPAPVPVEGGDIATMSPPPVLDQVIEEVELPEDVANVKEEQPCYEEGRPDGTSTKLDDYYDDMSGGVTPEIKGSRAYSPETARLYNIYGGEPRPADWKSLYKAELAGDSPVPSPPVVNIRVAPAYDDREKYNYRTRGICDEYTPSYQEIKIQQKERFMSERLAQEQREIAQERQEQASRGTRDKSRVVKIVARDQPQGMVCESLPPIQQQRTSPYPQPITTSPYPQPTAASSVYPQQQMSARTLPVQPKSFSPLEQFPAMSTGPSYGAPPPEGQILPPLKTAPYAAPLSPILKAPEPEEVETVETLPPLATSPIPIPKEHSAQISQQALFDQRMKSVSRARTLAAEKLRQDQLDREAQEMQRAKAWEEFWSNQTLDLLNAQTTEEITEPGVYSHEVSGAVSRTIPGLSQPAAVSSALCDDDPRTRSEMSQTEETGPYSGERPATVADVEQSEQQQQPPATTEAASSDDKPATTESIGEDQFDRYIEKMIQQSQSGADWPEKVAVQAEEAEIPAEQEPVDDAAVAAEATLEEEPLANQFAFDDGQLVGLSQEELKTSPPEDAAVKATVDQTDLVASEEQENAVLEWEKWRKRSSQPEEEMNREEIPPPTGSRQRPSTAHKQAQTDDMDCEEVMAEVRARRAAEEVRLREEAEAEQERREKEYLDRLRAEADAAEAARLARIREEKEAADKLEAECQRALQERADRIRAEEEASAKAREALMQAEMEARERVEKLSVATSKAQTEALEQSKIARRRSEMAEKARAQAAAKAAAAAAAKAQAEAMERARWAEQTRAAELAAQATKDAQIVKAAKAAREAELAAREAAEAAASAEKTQAWRNFLESQAGFIIASRTNLLGEPQPDCTQPVEDIGIPRVIQRNR